MLIVGLTGGIGSGKTAISDRFAALGVPVIDADVIARQIVEPGQAALDEIASAFGLDCLEVSGRLNRRNLRERVFNDPVARKTLESITHPRIRTAIRHNIAVVDAPYCIVVIPLLVESDLRKMVQRVLVVDVAESIQIERVMRRDSADEASAKAILASQTSREQRLAIADDVVDNSGELGELDVQVARLHQLYLKLGDQTPQ